MQQAAARFNNRGFVFKCLDLILNDEIEIPSDASATPDSLSQESFRPPKVEEIFRQDQEEQFSINNPYVYQYMPLSPLQDQMPLDFGLDQSVPVFDLPN